MISATFFKCDSGGHTRDSDMNYQLAKKGNNINTHDETQKYFNHKISVVIALALVIALSYFCDCLNLKCDCNICVCCVCTCTCNTQLFLCIFAFHTHVKLRKQTSHFHDEDIKKINNQCLHQDGQNLRFL